LVIEQDRKKGPTRAVYWRKVQGGDRRVQAQHAVRQLRWNIDPVPADATWISFSEAGQKRFHGVSHAGPVAMAVRIPLSGTGPISFGGHFDPEKESLYRLELIHRTNLCRQLSMLMDLLPSTIPWPRPTARACHEPARAASSASNRRRRSRRRCSTT
jgi:hypothetical protein